MYNIHNLSVDIPLNVLTFITGVSGSGKSTLIKELLFPLISREIDSRQISVKEKSHYLKGDLAQISHVEFVDQNPIGRSSRSNPATYVGAFEYIRQLFAEQALAKSRGYKPGFFSFNIEGGRCEACQGEGHISIKMQFMADVEIICDECKGKCYKDETLEVKIKDKNIYDILQLTVDEAIVFSIFAREPFNTKHCFLIATSFRCRYWLFTFSSIVNFFVGRRSSKSKISFFLGKGSKQQHTLFLFDEPTTGLHFHDIHNLYKAFKALIKQGHSIVVIEHNLDMIKCADWIIELGPEGGNKGGKIIFQGTPEDIVKCKQSHTANFLIKKLNLN